MPRADPPTSPQVKLPTPLHPSLQRAHDTVLREHWLSVRAKLVPCNCALIACSTRQTILPEQRLLEIPERIDDLLSFVPDEDVRASLAAKLKARQSAARRRRPASHPRRCSPASASRRLARRRLLLAGRWWSERLSAPRAGAAPPLWTAS